MECYQLHYRRLVRALVLAGAPTAVAEDLAQEAFARMLSHWARVRRGSSPAGYAYRSAFRLLHRSRRGRRALEEAEAGERPEARAADSRTADPEATATTRVAVAATLATMPPRRRACAVLCLVVGLSSADAASSLGIAEGTVRKHLAEAREDLRRVLAP